MNTKFVLVAAVLGVAFIASSRRKPPKKRRTAAPKIPVGGWTAASPIPHTTAN